MTRTAVFVIALFAALSAAASGPAARDGEATLHFTTNLKAKGEYRLTMRRSEFYLDGARLNDGEVARFGPQLTTVLALAHEAPADPQCAAGTFEHVVRLNGKTRSESGCLDDERFAKLTGAFKEMRAARSLIEEKR